MIKFAIKWLNGKTDETLHHDEWPDLSFIPKVVEGRRPSSVRTHWLQRLETWTSEAIETVRSVEI